MATISFNHQATNFSKNNLAYLSQWSTIIYRDKAAIHQRLQAEGLVFEIDECFISHPKTDTQCVVFGDANKIVIVFRGTEGKLEDWRTDRKFIRSKWQGVGTVHRGFNQAIDSVWFDIEQQLGRLRTNQQRIWLTGHSLGGALASLAAAKMLLTYSPNDIGGVYTYGQPRVGDFDFCDHFNRALKQKTFRMVNNNDVVTRVPLQSFGYSHIGTLMYFDTHGHLKPDAELGWWARFWDRLNGSFDDQGDLDLDAIDDHQMSLYQQFSERAYLETL